MVGSPCGTLFDSAKLLILGRFKSPPSHKRLRGVWGGGCETKGGARCCAWRSLLVGARETCVASTQHGATLSFTHRVSEIAETTIVSGDELEVWVPDPSAGERNVFIFDPLSWVNTAPFFITLSDGERSSPSARRSEDRTDSMTAAGTSACGVSGSEVVGVLGVSVPWRCRLVAMVVWARGGGSFRIAACRVRLPGMP